ncbi:MAG: TIGR04149 family rSAM-modified RiPP [Candidatus Symbiothrix sp.]|jgi:natural product precursor|nr:TIGR04149 family rSAM-modified RiPP [Candidatus Symbiothrix sp.]
MKTNLKLNALASDNLSKVEMNQVQGGGCCTCGCKGSSSTEANGGANMDSGKNSKGGGDQFCCCEKLPELTVTP